MRKMIVAWRHSQCSPWAAPASAAKGIKYKGKTSAGYPITFTLKKNRLYD